MAIPSSRRAIYILITFTLMIFLWINAQYLSRSQSQSIRGAIIPLAPKSRTVPTTRSRISASESACKWNPRAVSTNNSPRRVQLLAAARITGVDISIPDQPAWSDADVNRIKAKKGSTISRASTMAWLGHMNALQWFMSTRYETALIIEDDVDWDIRIRHKQIPLLANALQELMARVNGGGEKKHGKSYDAPADSLSRTTHRPSAWPPSSDWELLYLGHCGDFFPARNLSQLPHTVYHDPTMPSFSGLHVDTQRFMHPIPIPAKNRIIHRSDRVLCTFAYAITKTSAARMLRDLSRESEGTGTVAYDVRIMEACRDLGWNCWSVNPEVFHHLSEHSSEIHSLNGKPLIMDKSPPSQEELRNVNARGTPNVGCGARGIANHIDGDPQAVELIRIAQSVDNFCPLPGDEIDAMRGRIAVRPREDIPIG